MSLIKHYGRMWARNQKNIELIPGNGRGVYVLYDGSMPVYIGIGNLRSRIQKARRSKRRGQLWDHFSWYIPSTPTHSREIEALLLSMLPFYLRVLNRQRGKIPHRFIEKSKTDQQPEVITRATLPPRTRR